MRWINVGALSMTLVLTSCAEAAEDTTTTTGEAITTTTAAVTTTTTAPTTAASRTPSAEEALGDFFVAVREADQAIAATAQAFNAGFDAEEGTLTAEAKQTVTDLDIGRIDWLIPAGLSIELETAVLTVYSDLISRQAALHGAARYLYPDPQPDADMAEQNLEFVMTCLGNGHGANARFDADLAGAIRQARLEAPPPSLEPDSAEAGILAVREAWIVGGNTCCDSCGGYIYSEPMPVDWDDRGESFDAEFVDGHWQIGLHAG
jgi:hypothetical protein